MKRNDLRRSKTSVRKNVLSRRRKNNSRRERRQTRVTSSPSCSVPNRNVKRAGEINKWLAGGLGFGWWRFHGSYGLPSTTRRLVRLWVLLLNRLVRSQRDGTKGCHKMIEKLKETVSKAALSLGESIKSGI